MSVMERHVLFILKLYMKQNNMSRISWQKYVQAAVYWNIIL